MNDIDAKGIHRAFDRLYRLDPKGTIEHFNVTLPLRNMREAYAAFKKGLPLALNDVFRRIKV